MKQVFRTMGHGLCVSFHWIFRHIYLAVVLIFLVAFVSILSAASWGDTLGNTTGTLVGFAKGSYLGIAKGTGQAVEDAAAKALDPGDMEVRLGTTFQEKQNLQVLQVEFNLSDVFKVGKDYAALFTLPCTGIFSVDLRKSTAVFRKGGNLLITIPKPEFTPYFDESQIEMVDEFGKSKWSGDAKNGQQAFQDSIISLKENVRTEMAGYETLMSTAEQTALKQVEQLARSVCGSACDVEIHFAEEGD